MGHETDRGGIDEGDSLARMTLEVLGNAAATDDPGEWALEVSPFGGNDETTRFIALDDLQRPAPSLCDDRGHLLSPIADFGENLFDEREQAARASIEDQPSAIAILQVGGVDDDVQQEVERVDENMPLAQIHRAFAPAVLGSLNGAWGVKGCDEARARAIRMLSRAHGTGVTAPKSARQEIRDLAAMSAGSNLSAASNN